jgi:hypothetical protein
MYCIFIVVNLYNNNKKKGLSYKINKFKKNCPLKYKVNQASNQKES